MLFTDAPECPICVRSCRSIEVHRECMLRTVLGGVGHLLDRDWWTLTVGDPDAGLPPRESAICVAWLVDRYGAEAVVSGDFEHPPLDLLHDLAMLASHQKGIRHA
jgi:hypothetical protein